MANRAIFIRTLRAIREFRGGKIGLQAVVNAVDLARSNIRPHSKNIEEIYLNLEIVNAVQLDERRPVNESERQEIERLLVRLESELGTVLAADKTDESWEEEQ
jgi:hypothetical protein